ncbi:MFS transporter [Streptomyces sp. NPDC015220]|uniref:MFS transporter n=1 Tax=Streptomyces sp. NPDC015220 TaxID=3364947 RepID=UPI0036F8A63C
MAEGWRGDFNFVWADETASLVGSQVYQLAMPLTAVLTFDATPAQFGLLGALTFAPYVILGLPAGLLVDRWQRRGVLILCNLGQALPIGAIPMLAAPDLLTFGRLLALARASGTARVFFTIAYRTAGTCGPLSAKPPVTTCAGRSSPRSSPCPRDCCCPSAPWAHCSARRSPTVSPTGWAWAAPW